MSFAKKNTFKKRKSGHTGNKKNMKCGRQLYSSSSKRSYVRNKIRKQHKNYTIINNDETVPENDEILHKHNSFNVCCSKNAARVKKRECDKLKDMILDKNKTEEQQALILHTVLTDPDLSNLIELAGIKIRSKFEQIALYSENRRLEILKLASSKSNEKGRVNDDKRSFIESQYVSVAISTTQK